MCQIKKPDVGRILLICLIAVSISVAGCSSFDGEADKTETSSVVPSEPSETKETATTPQRHTTDHPEHTSISPSTKTENPTQTITKSQSEILGERYDKYEQYSARYIGAITESSNTSLELSDIDTANKTIKIVHYAPTNNTSKYLLQQGVILTLYKYSIDRYADDEGTYADVDRSWIPRTINVTVRTQDGRLYERAHIKYEWGLARLNGTLTEREYELLYIGEAEPGPAHPEEGI
ncbi:hypothetical protein ACFQL1_13490 [Halomicroarcula sp. GCM10025709]|uniref:hypothetical protein n=1 Tax=Haloarcula TaxID=2237 RepID=UPI0024C36465|nr:hypothetical protein [Halomicroarcula sp. YJ-61-S]